MSILQAFVLGLIQGLTEFLPVSSSGHLILVPYIFKWEAQPLYFDVALHWGTLIAVGSYFWRDWVLMIQSVQKNWKGLKKQEFIKYPVELRLLFLIILGTIPAVIAGLLFQDVIENTLRSPYVVIFMLLTVAFYMYWAQEKPRVIKKMNNLKLKDGFVIGISQALALIPGTSRSGITISTGILKGLSKEEAARFSFLLSTPIILGAGIYEILKVLSSTREAIELLPLIVGFITAVITGFIAIRFLMSFLKNQKLTVFIVYRIALAIILVVFFTINR